MNSKKAVITILGLIGGNDNHQKATYYFEDKKEEKKDYFNTFPLLIEKFSNDYKIVPLYTKEALNGSASSKSAPLGSPSTRNPLNPFSFIK